MADRDTQAGPIRLLGIDHVVLRCTALERTLAFYREVLGCTLERENPSLGLYQLRAGRSLIDLVPVGSRLGGETAPERACFNLAHFCLRVEIGDWQRLGAWLEGHGVACEPPERRYGADGFGRSIYIEDPEGNTIELKGRPEPGADA